MPSTPRRNSGVKIFSHLGPRWTTNLFASSVDEITCPEIPSYEFVDHFVTKLHGNNDENASVEQFVTTLHGNNDENESVEHFVTTFTLHGNNDENEMLIELPNTITRSFIIIHQLFSS